jgi:hypothetical protein
MQHFAAFDNEKGKIMKEKVEMPKSKRLNLLTLVNERKPIWVKNRTAAASGRESGVLVIQIGGKDNYGKITIIPGNEPQCISDQIDYESIRSCRELPNLINRGALELLDPEQAEQYYSQNEERRNIMSTKMSKYINREQDNVPEPELVRYGNETFQDAVPATKKISKFSTTEPKAKIGDLCHKAQVEAIDERSMLESLIEQSEVLNEVDLEHVLRNGHFDAVKNWAKDQLREKAQ